MARNDHGDEVNRNGRDRNEQSDRETDSPPSLEPEKLTFDSEGLVLPAIEHDPMARWIATSLADDSSDRQWSIYGMTTYDKYCPTPKYYRLSNPRKSDLLFKFVNGRWIKVPERLNTRIHGKDFQGGWIMGFSERLDDFRIFRG